MNTVEPGSRLDAWLTAVAEGDSSDLHVGAFRRPMMRVHGALEAIEEMDLTPEETEEVCLAMVPEGRRQELQDTGSCDFAFEHGEDRYRANVFKQRGTYAMVCRRIPKNRMSFDKIGAPFNITAP